MFYWHSPRILCGAGSTKRYGVRPSVRPSLRLSVCLSTAANPLLLVCCCGPGRQGISIDCRSSGVRMRAVPRCQRTYIAELRLVLRPRPRAAFRNSAIRPPVSPSVCLSHGTAALAIGPLAACSLATAGHRRWADCGPVRGRT